MGLNPRKVVKGAGKVASGAAKGVGKAAKGAAANRQEEDVMIRPVNRREVKLPK